MTARPRKVDASFQIGRQQATTFPAIASVAGTWIEERQKLMAAFRAVRDLPQMAGIPTTESIVDRMAYTGSLHDAIRSSLYDAVPIAYWGKNPDLPLDPQQLGHLNKLMDEIRRVDGVFGFYDPAHKPIVVPELGPDAGMNSRYRWKTTGDSTVIVDRNIDKSRAMMVSFTKLPGRGDNINVVTAQGNHLIIDTGFGSSALDAMRAIKGQLGNSSGTSKIRLIVTHRDADHLSGVVSLVKSGEIVEEIIVGKGQEEGSKTWTNTTHQLGDKYKLPEEGPGIVQFLRKDMPDGEAMLRSVHTKESDGMFAWELRTHEDLEIKLLQLKDPDSENGASIVTRWSYRGHSTLSLGDASPKAMRRLLKQRKSLRSNVLKWSHHAWLPSTKLEKEIAAEFLLSVKPDLIVISNIGAKTHLENFKPLCDFIYSVLGPEVQLKWTYQDGEIRVYSRRRIPLAPTIAS
jgi:beta-lactamase superfamily II metal-dependent hydrolase